MEQEAENSDKSLVQTVGAAIAKRRNTKGWTQWQVAEFMNIEKETVSRLETGAISPSLTRLEQFAKLLDCDVSDFLRPGKPELEDQALSLVSRMQNLSESQQAMLIQLCGKMAMAMGKLSVEDRQVVENFLNDLL